MTHNDFGKILLAEECQKISLSEILEKVEQEIKKVLLQQCLEVSGIPVQISESKTGNGGIRYWFACPLCQKRCGILYQHQGALGCRNCLNVKYKKSAKKGMAEDIPFSS